MYACVQSCLTLYGPLDCSLPDSSVHGILQARILEWVAISFSRGSSWPRDWTCILCLQFLANKEFFSGKNGQISFKSNQAEKWGLYDTKLWFSVEIILLPGDIWQCLETFLVVTSWGEGMVPSGHRWGMLLNILPHSGCPHSKDLLLLSHFSRVWLCATP